MEQKLTLTTVATKFGAINLSFDKSKVRLTIDRSIILKSINTKQLRQK
jgi:hypothetical protein